MAVTGGASGMGAASARGFSSAGATVVIIDRNADGAASVAAELGGPEPQIGDVSDSSFCAAVIDGIVEQQQRIDVLVLSLIHI
mgnify:FL=1